LLIIVPTAAPNNVRVSQVTHSSITVQWGAVDCIHRNGNISGYSVWYEENGNSQTISIAGGSMSEVTIPGLIYSTEYSIKVAAVGTEGGIGVYSSFPTVIVTNGKSKEAM
jgi:chitodextrinase